VLAVLYDIHANLPALEAVLDDAQAEGAAPAEGAADATGEDISMEDVLGGSPRKRPEAAKESASEEVPQVESQHTF